MADKEGSHTPYELVLNLGDNKIRMQGEMPRESVALDVFLSTLLPLADAIIQVLVHELKKHGKQVSCRQGCSACCHQPVPMTPAEGRYLAGVIKMLPEVDRKRVRLRFKKNLAKLERAGLLEAWQSPHWPQLAAEERQRMAMAYFALQLPCPFLKKHCCSIHPYRPLACREYLVTSDAYFCALEEPNQVQMVNFPVKPSTVLANLQLGGNDPLWFPMVLLPQWNQQHQHEAVAIDHGESWLKKFIDGLNP